MNSQTRQPRRGRPRARDSRISAAAILAAAGELMESGGGDFSLRALAQSLGIDPMAIYHYFPSKESLLQALVAQSLQSLATIRPRLMRAPGLEGRLRILARAYVRSVRGRPNLVRTLTRGELPADQPISTFDGLLALVLEGRDLGAGERRVFRDVLVDYLHGYALGGPAVPAKGLDEGLALLVRCLPPEPDRLRRGE